jgi:hypothetical protein
VIAVIAEEKIEADVQHLEDLREIAEHGVLPTPVFCINGEIKTKGRLLQKSEIKRLLREAVSQRPSGSA